MLNELMKKNKNQINHLTPKNNLIGFYILLFAQVVSLIGSGMTCFVNTVFVYTDMGGSITHLMLIAAFSQIPGILVSPIAGIIADRIDRKWIIIIGDTVAAIATFTLRTLVVNNAFELWHLFVIVSVISIANHFQWPAFFSSVQLMVPRKKLGKANGLLEGGRTLGIIGAPVLAGAVVGFIQFEGVIFLDLLTFVFALIMVLCIRIPKLDKKLIKPIKKKSLLKETFYGWKYIIARPGLVGMLMLFAMANFLFAMVELFIFPLGLSIDGPMVLGMALGFGGIAMLAGSLIMTIWGGPKRRIRGIMIFMLIQIFALIFIGFQPGMVIFLVIGFMIFSFSVPIINACSGTVWHTKVPPELQGRVLAASGMVFTSAMQAGYLISGLLADNVFIPLLEPGGLLANNVGKILGTGSQSGIGFLFIVIGIISLILLLKGFSNKHLRGLDNELSGVVNKDIISNKQEGVMIENINLKN